MVKIATIQELAKHLDDPSPLRAFFIHGDNSFFKREACNAIIDKFTNSKRTEFSLIKFDDKNMDFQEVIAACEIAPFMCEHKCILVTDPPLNQISDSDLESLTNLIQDIPEFSTLIFYCISNELDFKKSKASKVLDVFSKYACSLGFSNKNTAANARDFVVQTVKSMGCTISSADAYLITEKANGDFEIIYNETTKLCMYKQKGTITREDIERLFSLYLSSTVFELTKFIFAGNYEGALNKLNLLKMQKEEPIAVLAELSSSFLDHYRGLVGRNAQKTIADITADFSYRPNVAFRVENAYRASAKYRDIFLERCLDLILEADIESKSGSTDKYLVLERLITNIFVVKEGMVS